MQYEADNPAGHRPHLGISGIGADCERSLWYQFHQAKTPRFPGRMLRLFQFGHDIEPELGKLLESIGFRTYLSNPQTGGQFRVQSPDNYFFGGSMDAIAVSPEEELFDGVKPSTPYIVDFKTCSNSSFQKFVRNGLKDWNFKYYCQLQCYMGFSEQLGRGQVKDAMLMAINKDNHELHVETVEFNQSIFDAMKMRADMIVMSEKPPARYSDDRENMKCRFCDYAEICHGEDLPEPSCRLCGYHKKHLVHGEKCEKGLNLTSCAEHMYNPYVFEDDFVPITFHNGAMEYDAFVNGPHRAKDLVTTDKPVLTSREIYDLHMLKDQTMIDTLLAFSARYRASVDVD